MDDAWHVLVAGGDSSGTRDALLERLAAAGGSSVETVDEASAMVLIASTTTATDRSVDVALQAWTTTRSAEDIVVILADGELARSTDSGSFGPSTSALSPSQQQYFATIPLYLDLRRASEDQRQLDLDRVISALKSPRTRSGTSWLVGSGASGPTPVAPPPGTSIDDDHQPLQIRAGRSRSLAVVAVLALGVLVVTIVASIAWLGYSASDPREPAPTPTTWPRTSTPTVRPDLDTSRSPRWMNPITLITGGIILLVAVGGAGVAYGRRIRPSPPPSSEPGPVPRVLALTDQTEAGRENNERPRDHVFMSYDFDADSELAHRLAADIEAVVDVWIAPESISPGESWLDAIDRGLLDSSVFVVVVTAASMSSPWVRKEIQAAMHLEVSSGRPRLLPVQFERCDVPLLLNTYQIISGIGMDYTITRDSLVEAVSSSR